MCNVGLEKEFFNQWYELFSFSSVGCGSLSKNFFSLWDNV